MKKAYTTIALFGLLVTLAVAANAQTAGRSELRASVPFEFSVGQTSLPACEYTIALVNPASDQVILRISARDGSRNAMVHMFSVKGKSATNSMLVFHRYGDRYFLAQAWVDGETEGLSAPKSNAERTTQRELASVKAQTETVSLRMR